jgi:PhoPQ-activated pathogenicity-related protein
VSNGAKEVPRVGDIWIPYSARSPNYFTRFFIPKIKVLFQSSDKIFKVEASNLSSQLVCWRLWQNIELQQAWQLDS